MQIDLPVHQTPGSKKVFYGINAFGFNHEMVICYIKHFDDSGRSDVTFRYTGIEAVATQVVETIHVELSAD